MAVKIPSKKYRFGLIRQSQDASVASAFKAAGATANQWTNPGAADTAYRTVYYTKGVPVADPGVTISDYAVTSQLGLHPELSNFHIDSRSGLGRINFSGPADILTLTPHIVGAMQAVAEGAATEWICTSGFKAGTVDFNAGLGYLHTVAMDKISSADAGTILENAVIDNLSFTFDFIQKGLARLVQVSGSWVGNEMNTDQTLSGTWVATTLTPLNNADVFTFTTFTSDSVDWSAQCIRRMVFNINNSVASNCATTGGKPNQYDFAPRYTWNIILDHNLTTEKALGDFQAGATVDVHITNNTVGTGSFKIDTPFCKIVSPPESYNGEYGGYNLQLEAYQSSTTSAATITLIDGLSWAYS